MLLETIKILEGKVYHLAYHQERFDITRKALFPHHPSIALASLITAPSQGLFRCRIIYNEDILSISYIPYEEKQIDSIKIVPSDIQYTYKYEDRQAINKLLKIHKDVDEILIEKDGYLSDTSIANIAFLEEGQWYTPSKPLLAGTTRARLLDEGFLKIKDIKKETILSMKNLALMNSMIGFKIITPKVIL